MMDLQVNLIENSTNTMDVLKKDETNPRWRKVFYPLPQGIHQVCAACAISHGLLCLFYAFYQREGIQNKHIIVIH